MINNKRIFLAYAMIFSAIVLLSCEKDGTDAGTSSSTKPTTPVVSGSFTESFDNMSSLGSKGWSFKNNSYPIGSNGWRQGRYEATVNAKIPVPYIGFPAHSATNTPQDFISCDATCVGIDGGTINAWLITPKISIKNGDVISFWTRAMDDYTATDPNTLGPLLLTDRVQIRANYIDGTDNVGTSATSVGSFTTGIGDINRNYIPNSYGGYPTGIWRKATLTISGLTAPVKDARFAFRYMGVQAGANGPVNYAGVVGIDDFTFTSN